MQANFHRCRCDVQPFGSLLGGEFLDVAKYQHDAVAVRQFVDARPYNGSRFLSLQQSIGWCAPLRELLDVVSVFSEGRQTLD